MSSVPRRIVAALLDGSLLGGLYFAYLLKFGTPDESGQIALRSFSDIAIVLAFVILYCPIAEGVTGQTLFKALLGIKSEEHTSELQSRLHLVCRLLLEKR